MNQSIGERLQQARQRLGLSIDEVSEKLKIRKDILLNFEANEFTSKFPSVYIRGFFRSYIKFLKLNETALWEEYSAIVGTQDDTNLSLGHLQIENAEEKIKDEAQITELDSNENSAKFVKPILQFVYFKWLIGGIIATILLVLFSCSFHGKDSPSSSIENIAEQEQNVHLQTYEEITLVALDTVQVFVRQESDKKRLFSGTLEKNERRAIAKEDVLQISFSEGRHLAIERSDGTSIRPQKEGRGWIRLP